MKTLSSILTPFSEVSKGMRTMLFISTIGLLISAWGLFVPEKGTLFPSLAEVLGAWVSLWKNGLFFHILMTLKLIAFATVISLFISTIFAYASTIPVFQPLAVILTKLRYNPIQGFTLFIMMSVGGGRNLQIALLVIFTSFYFINSLKHVVESIPEEDITRRRTQKMGSWQILWKVAIKDRADQWVEVVRQNLSMMLMMIVSVEAMDKNQGGIGALIVDTNRGLNFPRVFALQLTLLAIGIGIDLLLRRIYNSFPAQKRSR